MKGNRISRRRGKRDPGERVGGLTDDKNGLDDDVDDDRGLLHLLHLFVIIGDRAVRVGPGVVVRLVPATV